MEESDDLVSPQEFIDSISALSDAVAQQQDCAAAMLYRLMFRHERDTRVLDYYADQVLDGINGMGSKYAEEDYLNYLQYLKVVVPDAYEEYKNMYERLKEADNGDDLECDEMNQLEI